MKTLRLLLSAWVLGVRGWGLVSTFAFCLLPFVEAQDSFYLLICLLKCQLPLEPIQLRLGPYFSFTRLSAKAFLDDL